MIRRWFEDELRMQLKTFQANASNLRSQKFNNKGKSELYLIEN